MNPRKGGVVRTIRTGAVLDGRRVVWAPQPGPQSIALTLHGRRGDTGYDFLGTGGARGGGKTDLVIGNWIGHATRWGRLARGLVIRREYTQLRGMMKRCEELTAPIGGRLVGNPAVLYMPNGAELWFRGVWDEAAASKYMGDWFTRVYAEELTNWPVPAPVLKLLACLRSGRGVPTMMMSSCNPGGVGHHWVKSMLIDPAPGGYKTIIEPEYNMRMAFIPAQLEDNPALMEADPDYERKIRAAAGSARMADAWRWGLWDIDPDGALGDVWDSRQVVIEPFEIPDGWEWAFGFDWGHRAPSAAYWAVISDGREVETPAGRRVFPRGSIIVTHEYYTIRAGRNGQPIPNEGLQIPNPELGRAIMTEEQIVLDGRKPSWAARVADPSIFSDMGGPSVYDQMAMGAGKAPMWRGADNNRMAGFQTVVSLLHAASDSGEAGLPGMWFFSTCVNAIRTIPVLQRHPRIIDDVDTFGEDHSYDAIRYIAQAVARPHRVSAMRVLGY